MKTLNKKIILIDMDSVQCRYTQELLKRAHERFDLPLYKEEDISLFDSEKVFPKEFWEKVDALSHEPDFFESLLPYDYIVEAVQEMAQDERLAIFFCTSPKKEYIDCVPGKYAWIEKSHGKKWTEKMIMTRDKTLVHGDILIDDKPEITGANPNPTWQHVFFDPPYNRKENNPRIKDWRNWKEVLFPILNLE